MNRAGLLISLAATFAAPAFAEEAVACWHYGDSPGLFAWTQPPSTACRDGAAVAAAAGPLPSATPPPPRSETVFEAATRPPETAFTFGGTAYFGIGARF